MGGFGDLAVGAVLAEILPGGLLVALQSETSTYRYLREGLSLPRHAQEGVSADEPCWLRK